MTVATEPAEATAKPIVTPSLPGLTLGSSKYILRPETMIAQLWWSPSGVGKTRLAGSLDALTQKYMGKRTLYIACEAAEGGGAATNSDLDLPILTPSTLSELNKITATLKNDKTLGGVVLDSGTETARVHVKRDTLKYPCRENVATRAAGVMTRSDYQVAGSLMDDILRSLMALTTLSNQDYRKHIIVTATDRTENDDEGNAKWEGPNFPGYMAHGSVEMFQQVGYLYVKAAVVDKKRVVQRYITFHTDGVKQAKDRMKIYPTEGLLLRENPSVPGEDVLTLYEKYWLPAIQRKDPK